MTQERLLILNRLSAFRHDHEKHNIPLGALVEFEIQMDGSNIGIEGKARLYVIGHGRDCDGTPLYTLGERPIGSPKAHPETERVDPEEDLRFHWVVTRVFNCYSEESLTPTGDHADHFYPTVWDFCDMLRGELKRG